MEIRKVDDYVDRLHEQFPELTKQEIKRILVYGFKMIILYSRSGNSIWIKDRSISFFVGKLTRDALYNFKTYCYKLGKRIAYMFYRTKSEWDGYYYFGRTENQYKDYLSQLRKIIKTFKHVKLFKLLDELKVSLNNAQYIFRLKDNTKTKYLRKYYPEIKTKDAELIIHRDILNMEDLMVSNNKYKYIQ